MKKQLVLIIVLCCPIFMIAQDLEIAGKAKIGTMDKVNTADSVVVRLADSTLAIRDVSTLTEMQILSISNDTIFLSDGGFVELPADQVDDADADPTNELQSWTNLPGIPMGFADDIDDVDDADADPANEIQILSISNDTIFLSDGQFVKLPADMNAGWTMDADTTSTLKHVGIGVTNPSEKLEVSGKIKSITPNYGLVHTHGGIQMGTYVSGTGGEIGTQSNHSLHFFTNNKLPSMTLTPDGDFGIGTDTPGAKLEVAGPVRVGGKITNVTDPMDAQDAATKAYVDKLLDEIDWLKGLLGIGEVTDSEGNVYPTVQIGTQFWMAKNLNVGVRIDGTTEQTNNSTIEKYCYDDIPANCDVYGGLYQWDEVMQYMTTEGAQGICPVGWHIPTDAEWTTLIDYLGDVSVAGGKMKEAGLTHWDSPNWAATNESGFTGLPGGGRFFFGTFHFIGNGGYWWSSTESNASNAWYRVMNYDDDFVFRGNNDKEYGYSVRCLRD